jgi:hypothetical protein
LYSLSFAQSSSGIPSDLFAHPSDGYRDLAGFTILLGKEDKILIAKKRPLLSGGLFILSEQKISSSLF